MNRDKIKLELIKLSKSYFQSGRPPLQVLKNINLEVYEKELVCIVGRSGCGKTTLLRLAAGLETPDEGFVLLNGLRSSNPSPSKGMVFQDLTLFPWRTVRRNVEFGLEFKGLPKEERREISDRYIHLVGLEGWEDRYPHELSGGMQQRVAIARALAPDPEVLLMDEPFNALDAQTREIMQDEVISIWEATKKTIIFVTHNLDEAIFLADEIIVLTPRPAQVKAVHQINFKRPRDRTGLQFQKRKKIILKQIFNH